MQHSVQNRAILMNLSIGTPGNTRKDKRVTEEVTKDKSMQTGAGRWMKSLFPEAALEPLSKLGREAREYHYSVTLPWSDEGWRILPTALHTEYAEKMRKFRRDFNDLSENHFIGRYQEWITWSKIAHNGCWDASNYHAVDSLGTFHPENSREVDKIRSKFRFETEAQAIPSAQDFRVDLSNEEVALLQGNVDQRVKRALEEANRDLWKRLIDPVRCMVERLKDPDNKFKDSLIGNIREIVALMPKLNLSGDHALDSFAQMIEQELSQHEPQMLRDSKATRAEAARRAEEILAKMSGYLA